MTERGALRECQQCRGTKANGDRCGRRTCKTTEYCWQHLKAETGLRVGKSKIRGAGNGLFAARDFKKGSQVAKYAGPLRHLTPAEIDRRKNEYLLEAYNGAYIDARGTQTSIGRYVNECRSGNKRAGECRGYNARLTRPTRRPDGRYVGGFRAQRNIKSGEEIYASYGVAYRRSNAPKRG